MKKLLQVSAVLIAAVLLFAGCKSNVEDKGEPPVVEDVFLTGAVNFTDLTWTQAEAYKTTTITLANTPNLVIALTDIDHDISQVQISTDSAFESWIYWEWKPENYVQKDSWWTVCTISTTNLKAETIANLKGTNKTVYVRAMDSKENYSEVKSLTGITIN